jgi:DNA replication protein DnaC
MSQLQDGKLDPQFTFSHFPITATNQAAVEACHIVASHPGLAYNPLFLYGQAETSKTHLLQAIGNLIRAESPTRTILYLSCKQLMLQRSAVAQSLGYRKRVPAIRRSMSCFSTNLSIWQDRLHFKTNSCTLLLSSLVLASRLLSLLIAPPKHWRR